jgi:hypothetical protein
MWYVPSHIIDCGSLLDVVYPPIVLLHIWEVPKKMSSPQPQHFKGSLFVLSVFPGVAPKGLFPLREGKFCWYTLLAGSLILEPFL